MNVTKEILRNKVDYLNHLTGLHYDLDFAYGGVRLIRIVNGSGGCSDCSVRMTKSQLADTLDAIEYVVLRMKEAESNV